MDTSADFLLTANAIIAAKTPEAVFGAAVGSDEADRLHAVAVLYRQIVVVIHPDRQPDRRKPKANEALRALTALKELAEAKIRAGTYGDTTKAAPPPAAPVRTAGPVTIKSKAHTYTMTELLTSGDLADLYRATHTALGETFNVVAKVGRDPADNDLLEAEATALRTIWKALDKQPKFANYFPPLIDALRVKADGKVRQVNVLGDLSDRYSLAEVMAAYSRGIDWRDAIWMFRRVLGGLGFAHRQGIIHGAVIPEHVVLRLSDHCGTLIDWAYSVVDPAKTGNRVKAIVESRQAFYPPEVLAKKPATPATDVYMAAQCFSVLVGRQCVPGSISIVIDRCVRTDPSLRPHDAWELHEHIGALMDNAAGKRTFRPFVMPQKP